MPTIRVKAVTGGPEMLDKLLDKGYINAGQHKQATTQGISPVRPKSKLIGG